MYTSFAPWDFQKHFSKTFRTGKLGFCAFHCYDPYLEKLYLDKLTHLVGNSHSWKVLEGKEITKSWIEENLLTWDMFKQDESFKVILGEEINSSTQKFILENRIDWEEQNTLIVFHKVNSFFDKLKKQEWAQVLRVESPKFWEANRLLAFTCEAFGIQFSRGIQELILEKVPHDPGDFIAAIKLLLQFEKERGKLEIEDVSELLKSSHLNQFEFSQLWGQRKFKIFYQNLLDLNCDYSELIGFFRFMQGHISKVLSPEYGEAKAKLSRYDRQIVAESRLWRKEELLSELRTFGEWEILAKRKSESLRLEIRSRLLDWTA